MAFTPIASKKDPQLQKELSEKLTMGKEELLRLLNQRKMKVVLCWCGNELVELYDKKVKPKALALAIEKRATEYLSDTYIDKKEKNKAVIKAAESRIGDVVKSLDPMPKRLRGVVEWSKEPNADGTPNPNGPDCLLYTLHALTGEDQFRLALKQRLKQTIVFRKGGDDVGEEDEADEAPTAQTQPPGPAPQQTAPGPAPNASEQQATQSGSQETTTPITPLKASVATNYATVWTRTRTAIEEALVKFGKEVEDTYKGQPFAAQIPGAYKSKVLDPIFGTLNLSLAEQMTEVASKETDPAAQKEKIGEALKTVKGFQTALSSGPVADILAEVNEKNPWTPIKAGPILGKVLADLEKELVTHA